MVSTLGRRSGIVFDGDDTLWSTEQLYDVARQSARAIVERAGLSGPNWEVLERRIDVENVAKLGYSPLRFPRSCVEAYEELCRRNSIAIDGSIATRIEQVASDVFVQEPPLMPDAHQTLSALRDRGIRLALLTKGDLTVQQRRIETSGLAEFFDVVHIVDEKTPNAILEVIARLDVEPHCSWMVGNSIRSDILPALAAGLRTAWIDAHVWEHERSHDHLLDDRIARIDNLGDLMRVLGV
jgi:putative hydrolase of the HAD superfamily